MLVLRDTKEEVKGTRGKLILEEQGEAVYRFVSEYVNVELDTTELFKTTTRFNIERLKNDGTKSIVNFSRINDVKNINSLITAVNTKLPNGGSFIGCVETIDQRKRRLFNKYPWGLNSIYYFFDFIFKRVFPKLPVTRSIHDFITAGRNRPLSKAETMGRLIYGGFKIGKVAEIENRLYFIAFKEQEPSDDPTPSKGFLLKISRIGYKGKPINVYKFRTMHPYAEYLQQYVYETNKLRSGGKFKNDFRITSWGRFLRRFWIDEFPMLINMVKGEVRLIGVRPLSTHYLSLYTEELKALRQQTRPGMIPPFYADLPTTLEEIMLSEKRYLEAYKKNPTRTKARYFMKAVRNIIFRSARSN